ncbi:MAG: TIGR03087 family PEP-CTERM/XrtA system glycosyltransferase [Methylococcaceae bacterium]
MENLLFLVHRIPYPPNKGDKIRSYHFLKYLAENYNVYLGTFIDDANDWQYTEKVDALCAKTHYENLNSFQSKIKSVQGFFTGEALSLPYYKNQAMQNWVNDTIKTHSIQKVLIFSSVMAQFVETIKNLEIVVDFVDVDSDKWRQYAEKKQGIARWIYQRESKYLLAYEQKIAEIAKSSFFVSEQEAALFTSLTHASTDKIGYINNGVDIDYFSPDLQFNSLYNDADDVIVFTGVMDYWANVDAVTWFANQVFPKILQENPKVKFYIVGSKPTKDVLELANENVIVTGFVDDVRAYLSHAKLVVAPLRIARGIQNKVLEAMAMGKYVVATSAAFEGILHDNNLNVFVIDDALEMANKISELLQTDSIKVSNVNHDFVKEKFSWEQNTHQLSVLLDQE